MSMEVGGEEAAADGDWRSSARGADSPVAHYGMYYEGAYASDSKCGSGEDEDDEEDEEDARGMDVLDAFEDFNLRAQKRIQELLDATDRRLFDLSPRAKDTRGEDAGELPVHVYLSDHFRLSKPPQFNHWQSTFQYLHVTGSAVISEPSDNHVCMVSGVPVVAAIGVQGTTDRTSLEPLAVIGRSCLTTPDDVNEPSEETIMADGSMEEIFVQDYREDQSDEESDGVGQWASDCVSPRATRVLEVEDALTIDCFSATVAPLMTSFFQVLLQKQQMMLRMQREAVETAQTQAVEEQLAAEQAERVQEQVRVAYEAERAAATVKAEKEEAIREAERHELFRQRQREKNDDEEVKIRTLAYSHTREWYQPDKKCFSHRGRQLTYLKPVLTTKEEDESSSNDPNSFGFNTSTQDAAFSARKPSKKPFPMPQKSSTRAHSGPLKASSKCTGAQVVRQQQPSTRSPSQSPPRSHQSRQREGKGEKKAHEQSTQHLRLPLIRKALSPEENGGKTSFSRRYSDDSDDGFVDNSSMVHSSRPANVYATSPYRIPSTSAPETEAAPAKTRRAVCTTSRVEKPR